MSYKYVPVKDILEVRKVRYDECWHIVYKWGTKATYDRVDFDEAMTVAQAMTNKQQEIYGR